MYKECDGKKINYFHNYYCVMKMMTKMKMVMMVMMMKKMMVMMRMTS